MADLTPVTDPEASPFPDAPSNCYDGNIQGVGYIVGGAAAGVAVLVGAPVAGAIQGGQNSVTQGVGGAVVGTGVGVAGLVGLTAAGVGVGVTQIARGAIRTPGWVINLVKRGPKSDLRGKKTIDLSEVASGLTAEERRYRAVRSRVDSAILGDAESEAEPKVAYVPTAVVKEKVFYEALSVLPDASTSQLRKAYFKKARQTHPDKGGSPSTFQIVGEAWKVLGNDDTRRTYDTKGAAALAAGAVDVDPAIQFAMLFGDDRFADIVGDLTLVAGMRLDALQPGLEPKERRSALAKMQMRRERRCAKLLAKKLEPWVAGQKEGREAFVTQAWAEREELKHCSLGEPMLQSVGESYEIVALRRLGHLKDGGFIGAALKDKAHTVAAYTRFAKGLRKMSDAQAKMAALDPSNDTEDATQEEMNDRQAKRNDLETQTNESLFDVLALDIESTCAAVARLVLADTSVTKAVRTERAEGLKALGKIYKGQEPKKPEAAEADAEASPLLSRDEASASAADAGASAGGASAGGASVGASGGASGGYSSASV